jgi:hypothetical protein
MRSRRNIVDRGRGRVLICLLLMAICIGALPILAHAEIAQKGDLRVTFDGNFSPHALPRANVKPISVSVSGRISTSDGAPPPQLRKILIAINRQGRLDYKGLPVCHLRQIQPSTNSGALAACRSALVGSGSFSADVKLPQQSPFPSSGKVLAFNGVIKGRPVILAHVYGTEPIPTSYTLPFAINSAKGTFATALSVDLPQVTSDWGFVTGISITLGRSFTSHGHTRGYLSASCPAPKGFPGVVFPLAKASFVFAKKTLTSTLTRSCGARG